MSNKTIKTLTWKEFHKEKGIPPKGVNVATMRNCKECESSIYARVLIAEPIIEIVCSKCKAVMGSFWLSGVTEVPNE